MGGLFNWPYWKFSDSRTLGISIPSGITIQGYVRPCRIPCPSFFPSRFKATYLISSLPFWKSCSCSWQMASSLLGEQHSLAECRSQQWAWQNLACVLQCNSSSTCLHGLPLQRENGPTIPSLNFYLWVKTISYFITLSSLSLAKERQALH